MSVAETNTHNKVTLKPVLIRENSITHSKQALSLTDTYHESSQEEGWGWGVGEVWEGSPCNINAL